MSGTKQRSERPFTSEKRCRSWDGAKTDLNLYTFTGDSLWNVQLVCCWKVFLPGRISSSKGWERPAATARPGTNKVQVFSWAAHLGRGKLLLRTDTAESAAVQRPSLLCSAQSEREVVPFSYVTGLQTNLRWHLLYLENPHCVKSKQRYHLICKQMEESISHSPFLNIFLTPGRGLSSTL